MNLICNNCGGADFYKIHKQPFKNPFMWSCVFADDMIKLIKNYDNIDFSKIEMTRFTENIAKENNYIEYNEKSKICGLKVNDIFTVYYTHYIFNANCKKPTRISGNINYYRNFEYVYNKYNERLERMLKSNEEPSFLIIAFKRHGWTKEKLLELLNYNPKYKTLIITNEKIKTDNYSYKIIYDKSLNTKSGYFPITFIKKYDKIIKNYFQQN